jgi:O-antigen/teichoic acid export membrane protein
MAIELMQQIQDITIKISLIFLPMIFILAEPLITLICGGNYPEAALSLRYLIVSVFFVAANAFKIQFLLVCGKTEIYSKIHVTMAIIGLPLILLMISAFSYKGAAVATIFIEAGIFILTYLAIRKIH